MGQILNFSKIVRSVLLDIGICLDQLAEIGYYNEEQRNFLDKYLYKNEEALRAAGVRFALSVDGHPLLQLVAQKEGEEQSNGTASLSRSNGKGNTADQSHIRKGSKAPASVEKEVLNNFLQRCNARNFTVKVNGVEVANENGSEGKAADYNAILSPIAEGEVRATGEESPVVDSETNDSSEPLFHNTKIMLDGVSEVEPGSDIKPVDPENISESTTVTADLVNGSKPDSNQAVNGLTATEASMGINGDAEVVSNHVTHDNEFTQHGSSEIKCEAGVEIVEYEAPTTVAKAKITFVSASSLGDSSVHDKIVLIAPHGAAKPIQKVKVNAWGKVVKRAPWNDEGDVVGGSAEPLGQDNRGRAMLEKMGWSNGKGLGKEKDGILEPICHVVKNLKSGLGASTEKATAVELELPSTEISAVSAENTSESVSVPSENLEWGIGEETIKEIERAQMAQGATSPISSMESGSGRHDEAGIRTKFIKEGPGEGTKTQQRTVKFSVKLEATDGYKHSKHYPGVVIRAISAQKSNRVGRKNLLNVEVGDKLEVLRNRGGNDFDAYSFAKRMRGIVRISVVEMSCMPRSATEGEADKASAASW